jgi:hypothetical protein
MGPIDAVLHLANFSYPALALAAISTLAAKLLWRRTLAGVRWQHLAGWAALLGVIVLLGGLFVFGRDGRMATYGLLVLANAAGLWWAGFGPGRRG